MASFIGGIHPEYKKLTADRPTETMPAPKLLYIPVSQHIGVHCQPLVAVGDRVLAGQKIADSSAPVSSPIHSSVSGTVKEIVPFDHPGGTKVLTIVIENDGLDEPSPEMRPYPVAFEEITAKDLIELAKNSGIVGMGGAGFPAHIKLSSAAGKIDTLLINGAECEPYLTADHRLMTEQAELVVFGADLLRQGLGLSTVTICIEDNKEEAVRATQQQAANRPTVKVRVLPTKYPQGSEKHMIKAVTGREVPSGKLPADAGCAVFNVDSAASFARAYKTGMPVIKRYITVAGEGIAVRKNLVVSIGTLFSEVIEFCGGYSEKTAKLIMGGPMMGVAQFTDKVPVIKTTSGLLVFTDEEAVTEETGSCIRCGRCIRACPMQLEPCYMNRVAADLEACDKYNMLDCIECGSCSYVCPARINLVAQFRVSKLKLGEKKRKAAAEAKA